MIPKAVTRRSGFRKRSCPPIGHRRSTRGSIMQPHKVVSYEEWLVARKAHLSNEKALTRMRDIVAAERRALPWVKVDEELSCSTPRTARRSLADLFGDNSQLIVHHFMWRHDLDSGCPSCSFEADHAEGALVHLINHDVSYVHVARAPIGKLIAYGSGSAGRRRGPRHSTTTSTSTITSRSPRTSSRAARSTTISRTARTPRATRATNCRA